jgi:hypothetical protein
MKVNRIFAVVFAMALGMFLISASWAFAPATFFAVLSGGNEVSAEGVANAGDQNGRGSATVLIDIDRSTICFGISVTSITTPTAAHIHRGGIGKNGNIVVNLTPPSSGGPGSSSGCVRGVSQSLIRSILDNPSNFYVNVHTGDFPGGAVRGQLF